MVFCEKNVSVSSSEITEDENHQCIYEIIFTMKKKLSLILVCVTIFQNLLLIQSLKLAKSGYPKFPIPDCACGKRSVNWKPKREPRIVGGEEVPRGAVPWQVSVRYHGKHRCGGALISKQLVLTVAHCYKEDMTVLAGSHAHSDRFSFHRQTVKVDSGFIHPDFRKLGPYSYDIAVLILADPGFNINDYVKPACLTSEIPHPGIWCEVSGWGSEDARFPGKLSNNIRSAAVPILSLDTCRRNDIYGGRYQPILDNMVCAGHLRGGIDACGGDSGSPLVCDNNGRYELVGLVSWGDGCGKKDRPGIYTNVASFLDWIREMAIQSDVDI